MSTCDLLHLDPLVAAEVARTDPATPFRATTSAAVPATIFSAAPASCWTGAGPHRHAPHAHSTWARTFHSRPELVVAPRSVAEVQKAVRVARASRRRVVVVGAAHSPGAMTCSSGWLVRLDGLAEVGEVAPVRAADDEGGGAGAWGVVTAQAGVRLHALNERLAAQGWTLPALGSIDEQSLAGALATATHGSAIGAGARGTGGGGGSLLEHVRALRLVLGNGEVVRAAPGGATDELFRAALVSLGALGVVVEIEYAVRRDRRLRWTVEDASLDDMLAAWERGLWTQAEFTRVWWLPYARRMVVWRADETADESHKAGAAWLDTAVGHHVYAALLWLGHYVPAVLPAVERFVFGMQYGFRAGSTRGSGVAPQREALLMNCLYSQFVNEWALPLARGPEALRRLDGWIHRDPACGLALPRRLVYVHAPIEVRAADSSHMSPRAFLDPGMEGGPTLYLNATLYRPRGLDPPARAEYYAAFEALMAELGGRPHWAKNFSNAIAGPRFFGKRYGADMARWRAARRGADPDGVFVGPWLRANVLGDDEESMACEERFVAERRAQGGGWLVEGEVGGRGKAGSVGSEESYDVFARAEAEVGAL